MLRARLRGGTLNKLPVGLVYDSHGRVVFDPDRQVQQALIDCVLGQRLREVSEAFLPNPNIFQHLVRICQPLKRLGGLQ
jgi:hypothetical protein